MATFKAEIQNKRADGTYQIRIRITHKRIVRRISTNLFVTDEDITKGLKIKNINILNKCDDLIKQCRNFCTEVGFKLNNLTADQLAEDLKKHLEGGEKFGLDFIQYARQKSTQAKTKGTGDTYKDMANALVRFTNKEVLDISEININFLQKFEAFLVFEPSQRGNNRKSSIKSSTPKGERAVSKYLGCVRTIHNKAKDEYNDEDRGLIRIPYSPFKKYKVKPQPQTRKRALSVEQIQKIINLPYNDITRRNLAKDLFILSFVLIGMNSVDLYYAEPLRRGVLIYNRKKTTARRDDNAEMRVKVEDCIAPIIEKYNDDKKLFNFYKKYSNPQTFNRAINLGLKLIGDELGIEDLEYYAARHSWATIARSAAVNIDKATVSEALNHASSSVTDIYIDRDWSVIWNANTNVLALFDWSAVGYDVL